MIDLSSIALAYRLLIAIGVIIGPTLLFLGLWRFLEWLRDDRLVELLGHHGEGSGPLEPSGLDVFATATQSRTGAITCGNCGMLNDPSATLCLECETSL